MRDPRGDPDPATAASRGAPFELRAAGRRLLAQRVEVAPRAATAPADGRPPPTLVFLHEGLGCVGFWKRFPERLCARVGLPGLLYDRWGYGGSEPFDRPRSPRYLRDEAELALPEVLAAAGVERPIPVGHSDGGTIALLFAAAFPERPAALVAIAAHAFVEEAALAGIRAAGRAYAEGPLRRTLERFHGDRAPSVFEAWAGTWLSPGFRGWNIEPDLVRVRAPALLLQGEADEYATPAHLDAVAAAVGGPVEARLLPGCGHAPHLQTAEAVLAACAGFLDRHLPPPADGSGDASKGPGGTSVPRRG